MMRSHSFGDEEAPASSPETDDRPRASLAFHQTSFIGRVGELARLRALASPARVLSVVGPAGVGKSRLALEFARTFANPLEVCLRGSRNEEALLAAFASALGVRLPNGGERARLLGHAARLSASIVVFDACEGLDAGAVGALASIRDASSLPLLLTTQRALGVATEHVFTLGPLRDDEARALLLDRVLHARFGAGLASAEMHRVGALLERLSNLPLALELAASRLAVLDVADLLRRLADGLGVLDQSAALTATIDWAISLLGERHRNGLSQATRFDGCFDLEAAEAVIDLGPARVIDWLQEMVRRSLISVRRDARGVRYELYETVQHRAALHQSESAQNEVDRRFAGYFAHAAARHSGEHSGERSGERGGSVRLARQWVRHERRNLRVAEARAVDPVVVVEIVLAQELGRFSAEDFDIDRGRIQRALRCAREIGAEVLVTRTLVEEARFLRLRGRASEACPLLEEALSGAERTRLDDLIALTRVERGRALTDLGEYERARTDLELGLALAPKQPRLLADAHVSLGVIAYHEEDLEMAERAFERARVHYERADDGAGQAVALGNMAAVARSRSQLERARRGFGAAARLQRAEGNTRGEGIALSNLGNVERCMGRCADARLHLQEAARLLEGVDDHRSRSLAVCFLAFVDLAEGDLAEAERRFERARVEAEGVLPPRDLAMIIDGLAETAEARGERDRAAGLQAQARQLRTPRALLRVAADGGWFSQGPTRVSLERRRSAKLVLAALTALHERVPGESLSRDGMVEAGWPGERIQEKAARQRLYVLINTLRKLGLEALETTHEGYRLDPEVSLCVDVRANS